METIKERYADYDDIMNAKDLTICSLKKEFKDANDLINRLEPEVKELTVCNEGLMIDSQKKSVRISDLEDQLQRLRKDMGAGNQELLERIRTLELQITDLDSKLQMKDHQMLQMRTERDDAIRNEQ